MKKTTLLNVFVRSLFIHAALNFKRMQNLGFAMAVIPVINQLGLTKKESQEFLTKHLQVFNTHPYFSAPIIGTVVRLEEENTSRDEAVDVHSIKRSLMASYAAIGDIFFWGALRPFIAIISVLLIYMGLVFAPIVYLFVYTPIHFWVRVKGFIEGYRQGKRGFEFIRSMDMPSLAVKLRWISLGVLMALIIWLSRNGGYCPFTTSHTIIVKIVAMTVVILCLFLIKKGISQISIIYGAVVAFIILSWTGWIH